MRSQPQRACGGARIKAELIPPLAFIALPMKLAMMSPAKWHRELVTKLAAKSAALRKAQMMSITRLAATDQAGLPSDEAHMLAIADAARLGMRQDGFVDR
jgi:hypothetical protein